MAICILFGGEKGGTGKSTLSINMAIMSALMGHEVLFIDTDKQRTASQFFERRHEKEIDPPVFCIHLTGGQLHKDIRTHAKKYEIVIIDAGGQDSQELRSAMICPDVSKFYAPLQPSEFDLNTLVTLDQLSSIAKTYNENMTAHILLNMCPTHAKVRTAKEAAELVTQEFQENLNLCESKISHRIPYQYASREAQSVVEWERALINRMPAYQARSYQAKASNEMMALYKEVFAEEFVMNEALA
jgi:chromosome partitioning protein